MFEELWVLFADQPSLTSDQVNTAISSSTSTISSSDMPYPVGMFENKLLIRLDEGTTEQSYPNTFISELPATLDLKSDHQVSTFTQAELKPENNEPEEVQQGNID